MEVFKETEIEIECLSVFLYVGSFSVVIFLLFFCFSTSDILRNLREYLAGILFVLVLTNLQKEDNYQTKICFNL